MFPLGGSVRASASREARSPTSPSSTSPAGSRPGLPVVTSHGPVTVDVAFGGAMYAVLPAAAVGLDVVPGITTP